ncbi:KH domain-containing protein [Candidatus Uhrbacteria bacterium]|nr:KH domain-containing protein [Candidatus Uhrbacteria bacterium]
MADMNQDQAFIEYVVKSIVNHGADVKTERTVDERGVLITLYVNPDDMGYVIGRQGQTARALRILLKIVGAKENARVNLKIYEPEEMRRQHQESRSMQAPMTSDAGKHGDSGLVSDDDLADLGI